MLIVSVINPPEGMLSKWWKMNYEEVGFFGEMMQMQKSHPLGKSSEAKVLVMIIVTSSCFIQMFTYLTFIAFNLQGKQMLGSKQDLNASLSKRHPIMQPKKQLLSKIFFQYAFLCSLLYLYSFHIRKDY